MTGLSYELGRVYWITGLSGAGKTTIGKNVFEKLKAKKPNVVMLDGDIVRQAVEDDLGHSPEDRRKSAMRKGRLCKLLADQGIDVVCATISLFHECHRWNRENIRRYSEVYLKVPLDILIKRDSKGIYKKAKEENAANVWGIDIFVEEPIAPDILIDNSGNQSPESIADQILSAVLNEREMRKNHSAQSISGKPSLGDMRGPV